LRNIYSKIGVTSRTEAAMYAVNSGLVPTVGIEKEYSGDEKILLSKQSWLMWAIFVFLVAAMGGVGYKLLVDKGNAKESFASPADIPRWQVMADMPTARFGLAVTVLESKLYVIGGETEDGVTNKVEVYDLNKNKWNSLTSKPVSVADIGAVVIGGKIYIPGGRQASGEVTDVLEIFDPREDKWTRGVEMPIGLSAYGLTAHEGKLYLFGGWDGNQYVSDVFEYDPEEDTWLEIGALNTPRGYIGVANTGDKIFLLGGYDGNHVFDFVEVFSPALLGNGDPWKKEAPLPEGLYGMGVASIADIVYVIGGESDNLREYSALAFFSEDGVWRIVENPEEEVGAFLGATSQGTRLFAVGGKNNSEPSAQNQVFQAIYTVSFPVIVK
jgi:N-acetylneuraminic acid mutarotase